jgi:hypothetical protein
MKGEIFPVPVETTMTKDVYEKVAEHAHVDQYWSKSCVSMRRKACRAFLALWCDAVVDGTQRDFEAEWGAPAKRQKIDTDDQAAHPATPGEESLPASPNESQQLSPGAESDDDDMCAS